MQRHLQLLAKATPEQIEAASRVLEKGDVKVTLDDRVYYRINNTAVTEVRTTDGRIAVIGDIPITPGTADIVGNTVSVHSNNPTRHLSRLHKHITRHMTDNGDGEFIVSFKNCGPFHFWFVAGNDHEAKLPGREPIGFRVTGQKLKISGDIYQFEIYGRYYGYRLVTGDEDLLEKL